MSATPEKKPRPTVDKWASEKLEAGEPISHLRQIRETGHWRLAAWVHKERKRGANIKTLREMFDDVGGDAENTAQGTASKTDDEATDEEGRRHAE